MKKFIFFLIPLALAYGTIVAAFYVDQRNLIFMPSKNDGMTPKDFGLSNYQDVKFKNPQGQTLDGWWIYHSHDQNRPVVLYCHGSAANLSMLSEVSKLFYDYGVDAFLFDYRSYGASEGSKSDLSEKAVDQDAMTAYQWLRNMDIGENRIIIWGQSLGSSVAAELATRTHPAGLILEGAFPSIYAVSRVRFPWLFMFPFMIHDPFETIQYVQERTCPLLEIHGEADTVVPIALGQEVYQAAVEPKQWMPIPGMNHLGFPKMAFQYEQPVMAFILGCERTAQHR